MFTYVASAQTNEPVKISNGTQNPGYFGIAAVGYGFAETDESTRFLKLDIINGYRVDQHLHFGIGTGLRHLLDVDAVLLPLLADIHGNLMKKSISAYLALSISYSFDLSNGFKGAGVLVNPSAGIRFNHSEDMTIFLGIGYEIQKIPSDYINPYDNSGSRINNKCPSINLA